MPVACAMGALPADARETRAAAAAIFEMECILNMMSWKAALYNELFDAVGVLRG